MGLIAKIKHHLRVHSARRRERAKEKRSPKWAGVRDAHLRQDPHCAACGGSKEPQVHHVTPFHLHPELELDPANLITLCMGAHECHLRIGHGDNFRSYNPNVRRDAGTVLKDPSTRDKIEMRAKVARIDGPE